MTKEELYISFICDEFKKGNITYKDVHLVFLSKFKCTEPTFVKYWKKAQKRHLEYLNKINKEKDILSIDAEKEAFKSNILTKLQRLEIASNIAQGKARKVNDQIIIPTDGDRIRALDYLAKIEGDYAPNKTDIKVSSTEINIVGKKFANEDNTE